MTDAKALRCIFSLRQRCDVVLKIIESIPTEKVSEVISKWGTDDWIRLQCAMCVKAMYAKAKFKKINRYSVVNTL